MNLDKEIEAIRGVGITPSVSLTVAIAPNSFEFGPASARHKIYYSDASDLKAKIKDAVDAEAYWSEIKSTEAKV